MSEVPLYAFQTRHERPLERHRPAVLHTLHRSALKRGYTAGLTRLAHSCAKPLPFALCHAQSEGIHMRIILTTMHSPA